ncbi:FAD/NAD(P)-binding protein [Streptomyces sp. SL13]|uniref:FAD/NAD(P)-binding protein n=1 Tax=Streptantibioticus silvisoli TaxID=2705255 RepID=A0AA90GTJ0_9ACTN|nr:FAD/NAD(P)-binding protein [Streptantibioticus silvisoli]MDI5967788.1 FAD/NAD(P)-binding protein [Streptantibioticus silvisoli]
MTERTVVVVGAGPRATGLLERMAAGAAELWSGRPLRVHLVDPCPPGPGRVWRMDQSPLLRMNSMAEDVTMFTDDSSTVEGPVRPGPSLADWAAQFAGRAPRWEPYEEPPSDVREELAGLAPTDFATRRAQSAYLDWVYRRVLADLPDTVRVEHHPTTATCVTGSPGGRQSVWLAGEVMPLTADLVVLAQGHLRSVPAPEHEALAEFAQAHGLFHLPPEYSCDARLGDLAPGEEVILRGMGLAFVDLVVLLTEGRGGAYREEADGSLTYLPSGKEPVIHAGSRRGVPYHAKTGYRLGGPRPPLPRYFGPPQARRLRAGGDPLDLRRDLWPLMAKEIGFGHYHELFHAHPERTALDWPRFLADYDRLDWYAPGMAELVARAVPAAGDRLDFEALDHPLAGRVFDSAADFQRYLRAYVSHDVDRREDEAYSADLGAFLGLLSVYGQLPAFLAGGRIAARSAARELDGWWHGFFSFLASGPPGFRLRQLQALSRAGVVRFLGADLRVAADEGGGVFVASSATVPGHSVRATALIEAYLPRASLERTADPLLRGLWEAGELTEEVIGDRTGTHRSGLITIAPDGRIVDPSAGGPHPRRIALGAPTNSRAVAAFARPRTDAPAFRQNDAAARLILRTLA